ncbi:MAG: hypothetical protein R2699_09250 [Acidimicrobiales bacterium]
MRFARVRTPVERLAQRFPKLFTEVQFAQASPFRRDQPGQHQRPADRQAPVHQHDAGRPIEIDPETLEHVTPWATTPMARRCRVSSSLSSSVAASRRRSTSTPCTS